MPLGLRTGATTGYPMPLTLPLLELPRGRRITHAPRGLGNDVAVTFASFLHGRAFPTCAAARELCCIAPPTAAARQPEFRQRGVVAVSCISTTYQVSFTGTCSPSSILSLVSDVEWVCGVERVVLHRPRVEVWGCVICTKFLATPGASFPGSVW